MNPWMLLLLLPVAWIGFSVYRGYRSPAQLQQMAEALSQGGTLLDVRSPMEFSGGHHRRARNIPLGELRPRAQELDADLPVVIYCRSGSRSGQALSILRSAGFGQLMDLGPYKNLDKLPKVRRTKKDAPPLTRNQRKRERKRQAKRQGRRRVRG